MNRVPFRRSNLYPEYYQYNFHYQTGRLSSSGQTRHVGADCAFFLCTTVAET